MANRYKVKLPYVQDPSAARVTEAKHVTELAEHDYEAKVVAEALPVALDFYAQDSKACELLGPRFAAVAEKFAGKVRFLKVSRAAAAKLAEKLSVTACPTIVFLQGGKERGERLTGEDIQRSELKARVEGLIGVTPAAAAPAAT